MGIIIEKLVVESALKKARAENTINRNARKKGTLNISSNHSFNVSKLLPFNCRLINVDPDTLKAA
jgi:hypothetical protein